MSPLDREAGILSLISGFPEAVRTQPWNPYSLRPVGRKRGNRPECFEESRPLRDQCPTQPNRVVRRYKKGKWAQPRWDLRDLGEEITRQGEGIKLPRTGYQANRRIGVNDKDKAMNSLKKERNQTESFILNSKQLERNQDQAYQKAWKKRKKS